MSRPEIKTTPTGIPITKCSTCGLEHPITRTHCTHCGKPTLFINADGTCLTCRKETT